MYLDHTCFLRTKSLVHFIVIETELIKVLVPKHLNGITTKQQFIK